MSVDYRARMLLDQREKEKKDQDLRSQIGDLSQKFNTFEKIVSSLNDVSEASSQSAVLMASVVSYTQQSNAILYTILDQLSTSQDIQSLQKTLSETLGEVKNVLEEIKSGIYLLKEPQVLGKKEKHIKK